MAEPFNDDHVMAVLEDRNFTIIDMIEDEERPGFTIVHDTRPEDTIKIYFITKDNAGEDILSLEFEGPDEYSEDEAISILNEVANAFIDIVEQASIEEGSGSGSGSGSI